MKTFKVWIHEWNGDEPYEIKAYDPQSAAEWLVQNKDDEYNVLNYPDGLEVQVAEPDSIRLFKFRVFAETRVNYNAVEEK